MADPLAWMVKSPDATSEKLPAYSTDPISRPRNIPLNSLRAVGLIVGSIETDGAWVVLGAAEGESDKLGDVLGLLDGIFDIDGWKLGAVEIDGAKEGNIDGTLDGMVEKDGLAEGSDEIDGWVDGIAEGASLCGTASTMIKSTIRRTPI